MASQEPDIAESPSGLGLNPTGPQARVRRAAIKPSVLATHARSPVRSPLQSKSRAGVVPRSGRLRPLDPSESYISTVHVRQKQRHEGTLVDKDRTSDESAEVMTFLGGEHFDLPVEDQGAVRWSGMGFNAKTIWDMKDKFEGPKMQLIDVSHNNIGLQGVLGVTVGLKHRESLTILNLSNCGLRLDAPSNRNSTEIDALLTLLRDAMFLVDLDLSRNRLGDAGAYNVAAALCYDNDVEEKGQQHLKAVERGSASPAVREWAQGIPPPEVSTSRTKLVTDRHTLLRLNLDHNRIGEEGCGAVCRLIVQLRHLQGLSLGYNNMGGIGAVAVLRELKEHKNLVAVDLRHNNFGEGATAVGLKVLLETNNVLQRLSLRYNRVWDDTSRHLVEGLRTNDCLEALFIGGNLMSEGAANALQRAGAGSQRRGGGCRVLQHHMSELAAVYAMEEAQAARGASMADEDVMKCPTSPSLRIKDVPGAEGAATQLHVLDVPGWPRQSFGRTQSKMEAMFADFDEIGLAEDLTTLQRRREKEQRRLASEEAFTAVLRAARATRRILGRFQSKAVDSGGAKVDVTTVTALARLVEYVDTPIDEDEFWKWKDPAQSAFMPVGSYTAQLTLSDSLNERPDPADDISTYCFCEPISSSYKYQKAGLSRRLHSQDDWIGLFAVGVNGSGGRAIIEPDGGRMDDISGLVARVKVPTANEGSVLCDLPHLQVAGTFQFIYVLGNTGSLTGLFACGATRVFRVAAPVAKLMLPPEVISGERVALKIMLHNALPGHTEDDFIAIFPSDRLRDDPALTGGIKSPAGTMRMVQRLPVNETKFQPQGLPPTGFEVCYVSTTPSTEFVAGSVDINVVRKLGDTAQAAAALAKLGGEPERELAPPLTRCLRVYLSMGGSDMNTERDLIAEQVLPAVNQACRERSAYIVLVDMRYGVQDEDEDIEDRITTCLTEQERCLPHVICALGHVYGPIPDEIPGDVLNRMPWIRGYKNKFVPHGAKVSLTELELANALLVSPNPESASNLRVYMREVSCSDQFGVVDRDGVKWQQQAMKDLKERISSSVPEKVRQYPHPNIFAKRCLRDILDIIEKELPLDGAPDNRTIVSINQQYLAKKFLHGAVERSEVLSDIDSHFKGNHRPLLLCGAPGCGKSTMLAAWCMKRVQDAAIAESVHDITDEGRSQTNTNCVIMRDGTPGSRPTLLISTFVGLTPLAMSPTLVLARTCGVITQAFNLKATAPSRAFLDPNKFEKLLRCAAAVGDVIIVIDGIDCSTEPTSLAFFDIFPEDLPVGVKCVLSTSAYEHTARASVRKWPALSMDILATSTKTGVLENYFKRMSTRFDPSDLAVLVSATCTSNALVLSLIMDELRTNQFEWDPKRVSVLLACDNVRDITQCVAAKWQTLDVPVYDAMTMLCIAPTGLTESELMGLLHIPGPRRPTSVWLSVFFYLSELAPRSAGVLCLCSQGFRVALLESLTESYKSTMRQLMVTFFEQRPLDSRQIDTLPGLLLQLGEKQRVFDYITQIDTFFMFYGDRDRRWDFMDTLLRTQKPLKDTLDRLRRNFEDRFKVGKRWFSDQNRTSGPYGKSWFSYYELAPQLLSSEKRLVHFSQYAIVLGSFYEDHGDHNEALTIIESTLKLLYGTTDFESIAQMQSKHTERTSVLLVRLARLYLSHMGYELSDATVKVTKPLEPPIRRYISRRLQVLFALAKRKLSRPEDLQPSEETAMRQLLGLHTTAVEILQQDEAASDISD